MTNNPLLQKYDELYGKQEEPKPILTSKIYNRDPSEIAMIERLLFELKSGLAVLIDSKGEQNYRHYDAREDFKRFSAVSSSPPEMMPLRIEEGIKITLTIFRKYR
jgi:hypothetical protein